MTEKQMEKKIEALAKRVTRLERRLKNGEHQSTTAQRALLSPASTTPKTISLEIARQAGLLVELPPEAKARAAEWHTLPEDERKRILDEFYNLKLDQSLADIIIENRR